MTIHSTRRAVFRAATALALGVLAAGCNTDKLLDVQDPDVVRPPSLNDPANISVVLSSAYAEVLAGYNGGTFEGIVNYAGLFTDEFIQTESFPTRFEVDTRNILQTNTSTRDVFRELSRGRASADRAARKYVEVELPNAIGRAEALNLAAFAYILFGENYCSGVPFSTLNDDESITYGSPQTTAEVFQIALAKLDTATTIATAVGGTTGTRQVNVARVLRGRALVNLARYAEAATAVAAVPSDFKVEFQHSDNTLRQNNGVWALSQNAGRWGVAEREGGVGLAFRSQADVRAPSRPRAINSGNGFDGGPMFESPKYGARNSPVVYVDGVEARLIEAEAKLRAGDASGFLTTLNDLRSNAAVLAARGYAAGSLPALADPGNEAGRVDLLFRERAYWLFLTAHRLGDMRRLVRQYNRSVNSVYPNGNYSSNGRTGVYGTDTSFPIPIEEQNNPNYPQGGDANKGCLNTNP